jgi:hypothetical protein
MEKRARDAYEQSQRVLKKLRSFKENDFHPKIPGLLEDLRRPSQVSTLPTTPMKLPRNSIVQSNQ